MLVSVGGLGVCDGPAHRAPWWWSYVLQLERRIESLRESAGMDPEKLAPPKDLWPLSRADDLEHWYTDRDKVRKHQAQQPELLDD